MEIKINAFTIHDFSFVQYSPNNLRTAVLKINITLGYEDGNDFIPSVFGDREITDTFQLEGDELISFLKASDGILFDFTWSELIKYLRRKLMKKYNIKECKNANFPGID